MPDNKDRGLYEKYKVERIDGKEVGPCVILEFKDPHARKAIKAFANSVREAGYFVLADDLEAKCDAFEPCANGGVCSASQAWEQLR